MEQNRKEWNVVWVWVYIVVVVKSLDLKWQTWQDKSGSVKVGS